MFLAGRLVAGAAVPAGAAAAACALAGGMRLGRSNVTLLRSGCSNGLLR